MNRGWSEEAATPLAAIPLREVSGLAWAAGPGRARVFAIGDASTRLLTTSGQSLAALRVADWSGSDLREWPARFGALPIGAASQFEAVAGDVTGQCLLLQEKPARVTVCDVSAKVVTCSIQLVATLPELANAWSSGRSGGEGLLLMRQGHLLVVNEKDPALLVEFGPAGDPPLGLGRQSWLEPDARWQSPGGWVSLVSLAAWAVPAGAVDLLPDLSDATIDPAGRLVLSSDQGASLAVAEAGAAGSQEFRVIAGSRVAGLRGKLEGLCTLADGTFILATDRRKPVDNCYFLPGRPLG